MDTFKENSEKLSCICSCGHNIKHSQIEKLGVYNWWQWTFLIFGISVRPKSYRYNCAICGESLDSK